jgi:transcriptional regulator with XRE-family HTH domain
MATKVQLRKSLEGRAFIRRFMLLQSGISIKSLAERLHISQSFASQLISGTRRSQEKEAALCRMLHVKREVLW